MLSHQLMDQRPNPATKKQFGMGIDNVQKHRLMRATQKRTTGSLFPLLLVALQNRAALIQLHRWEREARGSRALGEGLTARSGPGGKPRPPWRWGPPAISQLVHTFDLRTGGHQSFIAWESEATPLNFNCCYQEDLSPLNFDFMK